VSFDLVIAGGVLADGLGGALQPADVGITAGRIAAVGPALAGSARRVLRAEGCLVCPGFIDMHSHADLDLLCGRGAETRLLQGITTEVIGNCGFSFYPVAPERSQAAYDFLAMLFDDAQPEHLCADLEEYIRRVGRPSTNVVSLVGHNLLRLYANGCERRLGAGVQAAMEALLAAQLDAGAAGLSTGLLYAPACFADRDELTALARVARSRRRLLCCHIRDEGDGLAASIEEVLAVQAASGVALQVSHLKASGRRNWGHVPSILARLEAAVAAGADVRYDAYPFAFGCSTIITLLPTAMLDVPTERLMARLREPAGRAAVAAALARPECLLASVGAERIVIAGSVSEAMRRWVGRTLAEVAAAMGCSVVEALIEIVLADRGRTSIFLLQMDEDDVRRTATHPLGLLGSDGIPVQHGVAHPRLRSAFLQMLCRYVRQEGLLDLPSAVERLTAHPAARLGLAERGGLRPGCHADVVVADLEKLDPAADPFRASSWRGVDAVVLNGTVVVEHGALNGERAGVFVRYPRGGQP